MKSITENGKFLVAIVLSILSVIRIGSVYGIHGNHHTYLLKGLQMANPHLWSNDWWLNETSQYHYFFSYIVYFAEKMGVIVPIFIILNIVVVFLSYFYFWRILDYLWPKFSLMLLAITILITVGIFEAFSVGASFIHIRGFQPASIPTLGLIVGIFYFVRGKYIASGLFVGISALFHANFAILAMPLFGLAHLLLGKQALLERLLKQFIPQIVFFLPLLPSILQTVQLETPQHIVEEAIAAIKVRSSFHYDFAALSFRKFLLVNGLGLLSLFYLKNKLNDGKNFFSIMLALQIILMVAVIEGFLLNSIIVSRLFIWRLCPFLDFFSYSLIMMAVYEIAKSYPDKIRFITNDIVVGGMAKLVTTVAALSMVFITYDTYRPDRFSNGVDTFSDDMRAIYAHVRTDTPQTALFITPPSDATFRLFAERSVLVSDSEVPFAPLDTIEWLDRIKNITGNVEINRWDYAALLNRYHQLSPEQISELGRKYSADYILFIREFITDEGQLKLNHEVDLINDELLLLKINRQ